MMLRECHRLAREENRGCIVVEPIALYPMRDLHAAKDGRWMRTYPKPGARIGIGEVGVTGHGDDLAILRFANGHYLSQQALPEIEATGIATRLVDIRWLSPLPYDALVKAIGPARRVLIVDETRRTGGIAGELAANLAERIAAPITRLAAEDSFIATGPAYAATLPSKGGLVAAAQAAMR